MIQIDFKIERELNFRIGGQHVKGKVFVGDIFFQEPNNRWACHWSLSHLHHGVSLIYGKDPLDALINTLDFLATFIRGSEVDGYAIWWQSEGDNAGMRFPITEKHLGNRDVQ